MKTWIRLLIYVLLGGVAALFLKPGLWFDLRTEILTFLSILLGAVLFRLGRGLPQLTVERLRSSEVQRIGEAFEVVGDRLVWVFAVTGLAILCLILTEPLLAFGHSSIPIRGITWVSISLLALSLDRAIALVGGDRDLVRLQAGLLRRDTQKRDAEKSAAALNEAERQRPLSPHKGYGGIHGST